MPPKHLPPQEPIEEPFDVYAPEQEVHLRDYFFLVLKRRWLLIAIAAAVTAAATVRALIQTPLFSATAVVQITRGRVNLVDEVMVNDTGVKELYPTQQRVIRSRTLAHRVNDQLELWKHPNFRSGTDSEPSPEVRDSIAGEIQTMLSVNHVRNTQLLEIAYTTPNPDLSAQLANTLVRQYMAFSGETQTDLARNTASFIREQIEKLQQEIQQKEQLLQQYSQRDDIVMVDEKENLIIQKLGELDSQLTQAQGARAGAEARYGSLRAADPSTLPEVKRHPNVQSLLGQRSAIQKQYAELSSKFKPEWPEMQRTRNALAEVNREIEQQSQQVVREIIAEARVEYQSSLRRERLLTKEVDKQKKQAQELNTLTTDHTRIQAELDNQREMLQQLLRRHSETGLSAELGERQPVNVRLVEAAVVPKRPSYPNVQKSILMGALLGLALAFGTAFFLDYWDTSIHTIDDLRRHFSLPYLGMVPRYEPNAQLSSGQNLRSLPAGDVGGKKSRPSSKDLTRTRSSLALAKPSSSGPSNGDWSVVGERFKFLRGSLLMSNPGSPPKTVLVTGPEKNAGKTFVACNLAVSLAELDKKVLIIDADLRNPQLHRIFRYKNNVGLSSLLTGQAGLDKGTIFTTHLPNMFLMLSGPPCPSPAELLNSKQMDEVLDLCNKYFDYVLLDSAPLLPVFDSHGLATKCDANLLVVRSGQTSRYAVKSSLDFVERVGGRIAGVIINDVNLTDRAQNYYYSYHSYEYGTYYAADVKDKRV